MSIIVSIRKVLTTRTNLPTSVKCYTSRQSSKTQNIISETITNNGITRRQFLKNESGTREHENLNSTTKVKKNETVTTYTLIKVRINVSKIYRPLPFTHVLGPLGLLHPAPLP